MAKKIENIREYLESERERLRENLVVITGQGIDERQDNRSFGKKEETSTAYSELERRSANVGNVKEQLSEVEHALDKLINGTYGLCDECGGFIPSERLEVLPQTSLCLPCKVKQSKSPSKSDVAR